MNATWLTLYGKTLTPALIQQAAKVQLLICDVDGVLTDGNIYIDDTGESFKAFHAHDGHGIQLLRKQGIETAIITASNALSVDRRAEMLNIPYLYKGQADKRQHFLTLLEETTMLPEMCAYVGDDWIDWPIMKEVGLAVSVKNGHPLVTERASYVTTKAGGSGAVREVCDLILLAKGCFDYI